MRKRCSASCHVSLCPCDSGTAARLVSPPSIAYQRSLPIHSEPHPPHPTLTMTSSYAELLRPIDEYFEVSERGSTFGQELRGGFASFLTMSYILLVNPQILTAWLQIRESSPPHDWLEDTKKDISQDIATATALTCGLGSILVGVLSKMPFTIGPGMGLNTFIAGLLITTYSSDDPVEEEAAFQHAQKTWAEVSTTTFIVGLVLTLMSAVNIVAPVIQAMPETIKTSIMVGIGAYQAFIGLREMGIIVASSDDLVAIESFNNNSFSWDSEQRAQPTSGFAQLFFVIGLFTTATLFYRNVKGSILMGIAICTVLSWSCSVGGGEFPTPPVSVPQFSNNTFATLDFAAWFSSEYVKKFLPQVFVILIITVFDCGGVQFGVAKLLDLPKRFAEVEAGRKKQRTEERGERAHVIYNGNYEEEEAEDEERYSISNSINSRRQAAGSIERLQEISRVEKQITQLEKLEHDGVEGLSVIKATLRETFQRMQEVHAGASLMEGGTVVNTVNDGADSPMVPYSGPHSGQSDVTLPILEKALLPGRSAQMTFIAVGIANMFGSLFGSSPCIVFLECAAGVKEGARTGLASVFSGSMFLITVLLTPVFQKVPLCASAGPLVFIGCLMMGHIGEINWGDLLHALPAFLTILMMPFTSSITPGIGFGLFTYIALRGLVKLFDACVGPFKKPPALHVAAKKGDVAEIKRLTDAGADIEEEDYRQNRALHLAAIVGNQAVIQVLLALGADPNAVNSDNMTPLELSIKHGAYSSLATQSLQESSVISRMS